MISNLLSISTCCTHRRYSVRSGHSKVSGRLQRRMPASIARSNAGMPEERVIVTAVTLPSEVFNFTWYSAVGFSAPLREASDKPRPAARRHGLWRHSPRRGRRIRRSGCGRRCRPDAGRAERVVAESVLEGLVGGRLLAASSWPSSRRRPLGGDLFSRGLSAAAFSAAAFSAAAFLAASSLAFFSAAIFRLRPFPQRPSRRQPCQRPGVPAPGASPSARPACALPPGAPFPWRPRRLRVPFPLPHASSWLAAARSQGRLPTWAAGPWVRAEAGRIRLLLRLGFRLRLGLRLGFGRFGRGRRRNGRIAVRPELHFHRAGRFRAPVQVEDQHGQQQRVHQQGQKQGFPVVSVGRRGRGRCGVE